LPAELAQQVASSADLVWRAEPKPFHTEPVCLTVAWVELQHLSASELVPVEALRSGDPITDVYGGGEHYKVLESKCVCEGCVVLELESKADDRFRVIEKSFPTGYEVGRSPLRHW
jgi:hypothetical protein